MSLFEELKRRNVFRVGIAYLVTAWLVAQIADVVLGVILAPDWVMQALVLLLALGFPFALIFAWAFELTPEGLKKEKDVDRTRSITHRTGRKLDFTIIGILIFALAYFAIDKFVLDEGRSGPSATIKGSDPFSPTASDVAGDRAPTHSSPPGIPSQASEPPEKSIAVLPFVNMSADPEQEFFSDGISEELLNVLAKYPGLQVAARTSSFQFKGQNQDIGEIARLLKVRHVLEGSVRKAGNRLRITAQLIRADSGYHLWSETYDRELDDVFAIQDEISAAIGDALRVELALEESPEAQLPRVAESANTAAYEAFLRGRHLVNQRGRSNITQAVEDLKRAVRLDAEFAPAHAWMAIAWIMMMDSPSTYGDLTLAEVTQRASPHIEKALELNPGLAEAHGARALLAINSNDFEQAMTASARALELNPVYIDAMNWRQIAASSFGDYATALDILQRMVNADPLSIVGRLNYSGSLAGMDLEAGREMARSVVAQHAWAGYTALGAIEFGPGHDLSGSLGWFMRAYGEDPHDAFSNRYLIRILSLVGEYDEARRISDGNLHLVDIQQGRLESAVHTLERAHAADPENVAPMTELADALHLAGRIEESQRYYLRLREMSPQHLVFDALDASTRSTMRMAHNHVTLGEQAAARDAIAAHRADREKRHKLGLVFFSDHLAEAMARALEGDDEGAFESIRAAISLGFRELAFFREPSMSSLSGHPEFAALRADVERHVAAEHTEVLQLICRDNPIPDIWRPLRETCLPTGAGP